MGYRSQVGIKITGWNSEKEAKEYLSKIAEKYNSSEIDYIYDNFKIEDTKITYYEDHIKWYEDYEGIQYVEEVLKNIPKHVSYSFLRVGEEYDDIEEKFEGEDPEYISYTRIINMD